jgi:hypothetical protein
MVTGSRAAMVVVAGNRAAVVMVAGSRAAVIMVAGSRAAIVMVAGCLLKERNLVFLGYPYRWVRWQVLRWGTRVVVMVVGCPYKRKTKKGIKKLTSFFSIHIGCSEWGRGGHIQVVHGMYGMWRLGDGSGH